MENDSNYNRYLDILKKHSGIFTMGMKIPVRDAQALALVYTPGVAASCLEIQKNLSEAYRYTNKLNTMIVVTDSSGFKNYDNTTWNNMEPIPYLEAVCVYYKIYANIDCYPIVLDHKLIPDGKVLAETIKVLMPAYSLIEFINVDQKRIDEYNKEIGEHHEFATISSQCKRTFEEQIKKSGYNVSINLIYAALIRAALDTQSYKRLDDLVQMAINSLQEKKVSFENNDVFGLLQELVGSSATFLLENKFSCQTSKEVNLNNREMSVEYVRNKFRRFIQEGPKSWVDVFPDNVFTKDMSNNENSLMFHARYRGFVGSSTTIDLRNILILDKLLCWDNLERLSKMFHEDPLKSHIYSCRANLGAIITNGTAILGLGDIGALAGLPVMEGKSILFKLFGGTNIIPICVQEKDPKKLIEVCKRISPIFSCINLEDIKAPECFEVEQTLINCTPYPVFHDDQHGTAIVVLAGLINAIKLAGKKPEEVKVVMNGAGAAGLSVTELLIHHGMKNFIICDTTGAIYTGRPKNMNPFKERLAQLTNLKKQEGTLEEIIKGTDVFIGLSAGGALKEEWVKTMNDKPIIFALANPTPEIMPDLAHKAGAFVVATGRSDFHNQVNNSLAFPGIFRAAVDVRSTKISVEMKEAASMAIAGLIKPEELNPDYVIPSGLDSRVPIAVTNAVAKMAIQLGFAQNKKMTPDRVEENIMLWNLEDQILHWDEIEEYGLKYHQKLKKANY